MPEVSRVQWMHCNCDLVRLKHPATVSAFFSSTTSSAIKQHLPAVAVPSSAATAFSSSTTSSACR
jgi:hypothetical protein